MLPLVTTPSPALPVPAEPAPRRPSRLLRVLAVGPEPRHPYVYALLVVVFATLLAFALHPFEDLANLIMVYLLATVIAAVRLGRGPSITTTIVGTASFVYFFVPNRYSFVMADLTYLQTFTIMIVVGVLVSTLTSQLRAELLSTESRERRSWALYELSRALAGAESQADVERLVPHHVERAFRTTGLLLSGPHPDTDAARPLPASWSVADAEALGACTRNGTPQRTGALLLQPLIVTGEVVGVLALDVDGSPLTASDDVQLLESFANNIAVALHRVVVDARAERAHQRAEDERLRNVMLSSVSHDLRTPLAAITGAVTTMLENGPQLDDESRHELLGAIRDDADALERHVRNLLDLTRLESGGLEARRDWCSLEEVVGCALERVDSLLTDRPIDLDVPSDLPWPQVDGALVEQLLVNLIENAVRYTPTGSPITIAARCTPTSVRLSVADRGPGVPADRREHVFAKFYRGEGHRHAAGAGLGLAICRAIAHLHGGDVHVEDREGGGAVFVTTLPAALQPAPPARDGDLP